MSENAFDYYYGAESDQVSFIRIPKLLLCDPMFADLTLGSIVLYGVLMDRMSLSDENGWRDDKNRVYIRYKIKDIQKMMNISEKTATTYLQGIENIGLVEKVKVGLGQGNILYVKNFITPDTREKALHCGKIYSNGKRGKEEKSLKQIKNDEKVVEEGALEASKHPMPVEIGGNGAVDFGGNVAVENGGNVTVKIDGHSNTDMNKTKYNNNQSNQSKDKYLSIYKRRVSKVVDKDRIDEIDDAMIFRTGLMEQIGFEALCEDKPEKEAVISEIMETMVEMMLCNNPTQRISGNDFSSELVRQRIMKTYRKHIEYMLECLDKNTTKIANIKGYLKTTIFNAQTTIDSYYRAIANYDDYGKDTIIPKTYNGYTFEELERFANDG